jgi:hypothetical protein
MIFGKDKVRQSKPGDQAGLAVSSRCVVNADTGAGAVNLADERDLARQKLHTLALPHSFGDRQDLQEVYDTLCAGQSGFAPRFTAPARLVAAFFCVD